MNNAGPRRVADAATVWNRLFIVPIVAAIVIAIVLFFGATASESAVAAATPSAMGAKLFQQQCSSCHGLDGQGVTARGPSLEHEGEAAADFVLRTGRMPLAAPDLQATRGPVRFSEDEILSLVAYVGSIGDGPGTPVVDTNGANVANGGQLFRLNCAACHVSTGAGAPIGSGQQAPSLAQATPTQVGQAIIVGPGAMPVFGSLRSDQINDVAAYVAELQRDNTTAATSFGGAGPVAEGLAAWILALIPLVALTRWIGSPKAGRDHPVAQSAEYAMAPAGAPGTGGEQPTTAESGGTHSNATESNTPESSATASSATRRGSLVAVAVLAVVDWFARHGRSNDHHP